GPRLAGPVAVLPRGAADLGRDAVVERRQEASEQRLERLLVGHFVAKQAIELAGQQASVAACRRLSVRFGRSDLADAIATREACGKGDPLDEAPVGQRLRPDEIEYRRGTGELGRREDGGGGVLDRDRLHAVRPVS